jgi:UDP-glucose 4-epimerase
MSRDGILLLGGGYIGTALAHRLTLAGRTVEMISRKSIEMPNVSLHIGDLGDPALIAKMAAHCGTVIHLAAATTPGGSSRHPSKELENLVPTLHLLEAMQQWPSTHLIFLSSGGTIYGNPDTNPVTEGAHIAPLSYYGAGKVALESFIHAFLVAGHTATILRPSNIYGPAQPLRAGFGLIRNLLNHARNGTTAEIWGDGQSVRDYIYIDDAVEACIRFIGLPQDSGTYNLGRGVGYSVNQVVAQIETVCGARLQVTYRPTRQMDVREIVLDITSLENRLGWRPQINLEDGLRYTWEWLCRL